MADQQIMRELDGRRRISLTGIGDPEHRHYLADVDEGGVITLTPAVVVPASQVEAWKEAAADG